MLYVSLSLLLVAQLSAAALPDGRPHGNFMRLPSVPRIPASKTNGPVVSRNGTVLPPYTTVYLFDQLIDHNNPSLGTFKQRFWHTYEFYEPGGPIILNTPGETNADGFEGYLTNVTINGQIAEQQNGSTIVLEHRFYGFSNPFPNLTTQSLQVHTIQQAIDDLVYFANNVHLPMPNGDQLSPDKAPWILIGGSYAGALTSWTMINQPGVFFAGYSSSGVVEAIEDFWQYFEPIRLNMPKNCSADVQAVIQHVDSVFTGNNQTAIQALKDNWGMGNLTHLDDVAGSLRNNMWDWQSLQVYLGVEGQFFQFCDALEVSDGKIAPSTGFGLDHALAAWGAYWRSFYLGAICGDSSVTDCLGTYDPTLAFWTNTTIDDANRSWFWIVCNEVGFLQEGAPAGNPSLVTRLVQPPYDQRQCKMMFPDAFPGDVNIQTQRTNTLYKGWNVKNNRLFFANGIRDPWKDATVSSVNVNVSSTEEQPIAVGDGFHCSDLLTQSGTADATILAVQKKALATMKTWIATWEPKPKTTAQQDIVREGRNGRGGSVTQERAPPRSRKPVNVSFRDPVDA